MAVEKQASRGADVGWRLRLISCGQLLLWELRRHVDIEPTSVPHILLNCFDRGGRHPAILPDDYHLALDMTRIIFERGYRRPVFLNLNADIVTSHLCGKGFMDGAAAAGLDASGRVHIAVSSAAGAPTEFATRRILADLFSQADRPDLVLCGQDTPVRSASHF